MDEPRRSLDEMLGVTRSRARALRSRRDRRRVLGAAAAAVVLLAASLAVVARGDEGARVVSVSTPTEATSSTTDLDTTEPVPTTTGEPGSSTTVVPGEPSTTTGTTPRSTTTRQPTTTTTLEPLPGTWRGVADAPIRKRSVTPFWTGKEMLIWHGANPYGDYCVPQDAPDRRFNHECRSASLLSDGALYDPATNTWRMIPDDPLPDEPGDISAYAAAWSGTELLVWGGPDGAGERFDPATNTWRTMKKGPLSARGSVRAAWTGTELVLNGGYPDPEGKQGPANDTVAYDPTKDTWRRLPDSPSGLVGGAVAVGSRVVIDSTDGPQSLDVAAGRWTSLSAVPLPNSSLTTDGTHVLATNGEDLASLDLTTGRWTTLPRSPFTYIGAVVWSGSQLFVSEQQPFNRGGDARLRVAAFDPSTARWRVAPPAPIEHRYPLAVWGNGELVTWAGSSSGGAESTYNVDGGAIFRP